MRFSFLKNDFCGQIHWYQNLLISLLYVYSYYKWHASGSGHSVVEVVVDG